jgi:hypothetical protein
MTVMRYRHRWIAIVGVLLLRKSYKRPNNKNIFPFFFGTKIKLGYRAPDKTKSEKPQ